MTANSASSSTSKKIINYITWPTHSKSNFIRTSLPIVITCIAAKMLANTSYLYYSFLIATLTIASTEYINHKINSNPKIKIVKGNPIRPSTVLEDAIKRTANLKTTIKHFKPLGNLLAHRVLCTEEHYKSALITTSFEFLQIDLKVIKDAWENFPNDEEYDSRLDYLSQKVDKKFHNDFIKIKKDFNLQMQICLSKPEDFLKAR